jgi:hypothetical protein
MIRLFVSVFFLVTTSICWAAPSFSIINLQSEFLEFTSASLNASPEQLLAAWNTFEAKHQDLYDMFIFPRDNPDWEARRTGKLKRFFSMLPGLQPRMEYLFSGADAAIEKGVRAFYETFPDFSSDISVYVMPSVFSFNGSVQRANGELVFLYGVDLSAYLNSDNDDIRILIAHELSHVYHFAHMPSHDGTLASSLWTEGMATFTSGIVASDFLDARLLMEPNIGKRCEDDGYVASLAQEYILILDIRNDDPRVDSLFNGWFSYRFDGTLDDPGRKGYCLGLHVLKRLSKKYTVNQMMTWDEKMYLEQVRATLMAIGS